MFSKIFSGTLPLQGTDVAAKWDSLYLFLVYMSAFFFVLVVGAMIYFAVQYKDKPGRKSKYITGSHLLEAIWVIVPTALLLAIFGWGYVVYNGMTKAPSDAYEIRVIGKQWLWQFQYDNGQTTTNELYVPLDKPVKLVMTSQDVLHSFFVPNFRIKQDVVPGMYTTVWFHPQIAGKHQIYCAEYCGTAHSGMLAKVIALDEAQWKAWYAGKKIGEQPNATIDMQLGENTAAPVAKEGIAFAALPLVDQGRKVFETKGCVACHSPSGESKVGPSQKALFGHKVELADGSSVIADENYIRESIEKPNAKIVKGYQPVMPTFQGLISETEMNAVIAYIKSLK